MKLPSIYATGRALKTLWALFASFFVFGVLGLVPSACLKYSPDGETYFANIQAAKEFVRVVETDWPNNRVNVFTALQHMRSAYIETKENDPTKLGELDRLENWRLNSQTVVAEQMFLTEVRNHGSVIQEAPWFLGGKIGLFFLAGGILGVFAHFMLLSRLEKMEPRLRLILF